MQAEYLRYLRVPVHDVDYVWGDNNDAMINSDNVPNAKLHERLAEYLRYLRVPVHDVDYVWGDNGAMISNGVPVPDVDYVRGDNNMMITSGTVTDAKLHKRHDILSFHFERSLFVCGYTNLQPGIEGDTLSPAALKDALFFCRALGRHQISAKWINFENR